ncbi:acyl-ACP thioesterase [Spirochaeta thermophila DSM 6578]|uniref:Acyl-ACP thioesterase n=1 Tax=Winmispira thermophila (strain ATCC 700085 / DSM 6578 / Z-1203) TaxID=869211 RepID=G0GBL4_WINT7|nr:acyl-ACP thioesterase domain-containing protein [Spirochaeta thermophila]AEJ60373.1 acyl-ACP thioesterase [Spirochaeta thermophila DSM 6578]
MKYAERFVVRSYESCGKGFLRPDALAGYFQETAWKSAEELGFGYRAVVEHGWAWVLSRLLVRYERVPRWGEEVVVTTWPRPSEGIFACRDYLVEDGEGRVCVRATSRWLLLDAASRRPVRPERLVRMGLLEEAAVEEAPRKLGAEEGLKEAAMVIAGYVDVDPNGHVNNTRYIGWCTTGLVREGERPEAWREFHVNFVGEAHEGDACAIWVGDGAAEIRKGEVALARMRVERGSP